MHPYAQIIRRLRPAVVLVVLCAWFSLPSMTPARADEGKKDPISIAIDNIASGTLAPDAEQKYITSVSTNTKLMIGAVNSTRAGKGSGKVADLQVSVKCPGGRSFVKPKDEDASDEGELKRGKSTDGVVYCSLSGDGKGYKSVEIKVRNQLDKSVDYVLFVINKESWSGRGSIPPNPDLQHRRVDKLGTGKVHLYSVAYSVGYDKAKFLLQFAPTDQAHLDTQILARFYNPDDGSRKCSAAVLRQTSIDEVPSTTLMINTCDPLMSPLTKRDGHKQAPGAYLVVINYIGGDGAYCLYLGPNTSTPQPGTIRGCSPF